MKKRCKTSITDKIKVFKYLKTIVLLALLVLWITGCDPDTEKSKSTKQVSFHDASDVADYFADMYAGNKDGKSTMKEIASLNDHHMGGIIVICDLNGSIEFVDKVLEQSSQLAKGAEYKKVYDDGEMGLAIVMKARDLRCLDALARLKGDEWLSDPDKLAGTDMADLGGAFMAEQYAWKTHEIQKVLMQQKHGREGFRIFIVALMSDWSPPKYYNRFSNPELPLKEKVIKKVKEISNGKFSPQVIASLPDLVPGKAFAEKVAFLLDD